MRISLSKIKQTPGSRQEFTWLGAIDPAQWGYGEYSLPQPVECQGQAVNSGRGAFELSGSYRTVAQLICSRCGQPFLQPAEGAFSASFVAEATADWDGERSVFDLDGDTAELDQLIAGEIFFALPMQPLCREDCRGLCPICGVDLNRSSCSCQADTIDPRWEKLKDFTIDD